MLLDQKFILPLDFVQLLRVAEDHERSQMVDLGGIEPPPRQCECRVIPLYYRP